MGLRLCESCSILDLSPLVKNARDVFDEHQGGHKIIMDTPAAIAGRASACDLCGLLYAAMQRYGAPGELDDDGIMVFLRPWTSTPCGRRNHWELHRGYDRNVVWVGRQNINNPFLMSEDIELRILAGDDVPLSGRRVADEANVELMRTSIQHCKEKHREDDRPVLKRKSPLRLIDVQNMCLTEPAQSVHYAALSYIWGNVQTLKFTSTNAADLYTPGSLQSLEKQTPRTLRDAIDLTRQLGISYLWLDTLCVLQDSEEDLITQISELDQTYTGAALVIVAADGEHADSGLGCYHPRAPQSRQCTRKVTDTLELVVANYPWNHLGDSKWNSRAWTLQERTLASRVLTFVDGQVFWQCHSAYWCEDVVAEASEVQRADRSPENPISFYESAHALGFEWNPITNENAVLDVRVMGAYQRFLTEYSKRQLTFSSDYLRAATGALNHIGARIGSSMLYGLPEAYLDAVLLWQPEGTLELRDFSDRPEERPPSWSWAAWQGNVSHAVLPFRGIRPLVRWYKSSDPNKESSDRGFELVNGTGLGLPDNDLLHNVVHDSSRRPWSSDQLFNRAVDSSTIEPAYDGNLNRNRGYLMCRTYVASFKILEDEDDELPQRSAWSLFSPAKTAHHEPSAFAGARSRQDTWYGPRGRAGRVVLHSKGIVQSSLDDLHEFAVLSETTEIETGSTMLDPEAGLFYNVMMIRRIDGVATRIGLGEIYKSAFVKADPQYMSLWLA